MTPTKINLKVWIGTLAGIGFFPKAPGTVGSFITLILSYSLYLWMHPEIGSDQDSTSWIGQPEFFQVLFFTFLTLLSSLGVLWSADACEHKWGKDPSPVILDEAAGQLLLLVAIPLSGKLTEDWILLLGAFIGFRFFDIVKPLGIRSLQQLNGGFGILIDDLVAALYAIFVIVGLTFFI